MPQRRVAHQQQGRADNSTDGGCSSRVRFYLHDREAECDRRSKRSLVGWPAAANAPVPAHRSRDQPQAFDCRHSAEVTGGARNRLDRAIGAGDAYVRHHNRHRRLHCEWRCQPQLLRPEDSYLPRPRRRQGLRAGDRGQGERAGGAAGGAGAAELEAGAGGAGDQHRSLPVGREPLPDDAADPGGRPSRTLPAPAPGSTRSPSCAAAASTPASSSPR